MHPGRLNPTQGSTNGLMKPSDAALSRMTKWSGAARLGGCVRQWRGVDRSFIVPRADRRQQPEAQVSYGKDWYEQTREAAKLKRTPREELERRRRANAIANNGQERKDLFTNNWDGDRYKGSPVNILTVLVALLILTPTAGLIFARLTYGTLWG